MGTRTGGRTRLRAPAALGPRLLAGFVVLHGVAHFVGVGPALQAADEGDSMKFLYGAWHTSDAVLLRTAGALWAVVGGAVVLTAVLVWRRSDVARPTLAAVSAASLALSVINLPAAIVGVVIDVALLVVAVGAFGIIDDRRRATAT
jgi:hypothetical protein